MLIEIDKPPLIGRACACFACSTLLILETTMPSSKRDHARMERHLIVSLTDACEAAKAEIVGFEWLTHEADYQAFPQSLRVIWVFDTILNKGRALKAGQDKLMVAMTSTALQKAGLTALNVERHTYFDSEEECAASQGGDWVKRLAKVHGVRGNKLG